MENENVKIVSETLATSLENTQKNATDTDRSVQQVLSLSGKLFTHIQKLCPSAGNA